MRIDRYAAEGKQRLRFFVSGGRDEVEGQVAKAAILLVLFLTFFATAFGAPVYPVKPSADGRYLVDQSNSPYLMFGDSPHSLAVNASTNDLNTYCQDRKAVGFNAILVQALCKPYTGGRSDGSTLEGLLPFSGSLSGGYYDFSKPNEAYFAHLDYIIRVAGTNGLCVVLDPCDTGGWLTTAVQNGSNVCYTLGQYLGTRYAGFPNLIWHGGNDYDVSLWSVATNDYCMRGLELGIKSKDPNHVMSCELGVPSDSLENTNWYSAGLLSLDAAYDWSPTYNMVYTGYNRGLMPVFQTESGYENEGSPSPGGDYPPGSGNGEVWSPLRLRHTYYWTVLAGGLGGLLYGKHENWTCPPGWLAQVDTLSVTQLCSYATPLFTSRHYEKLVPDLGHSLVTAGYGFYSTVGRVSTNDYATAARTPDGTLGMVYVPTARTLTVAMTNFSAVVNARWYDPTAGTYTGVSGSPFTNAATQNFTTPGNNSGGDPDWVLVLEAQPASIVRPTLSVSGNTSGEFAISFSVVSGQTYELQTAVDLQNSSWVPIATYDLQDAGLVELILSNDVRELQRFYRVRTSK